MKENGMEFLVEFEVQVPVGTPEAEIDKREDAEATAADRLANEGHLVRLWSAPGENTVVGLYRADSETALDTLLAALPLHDWMHVDVRPLTPHPNDPAQP
jgi:muconolactone D-isomerase